MPFTGSKVLFKSAASITSFLLFSLVWGPLDSRGYFQDIGYGARPIGMGEAFTAVADDSNTMLWNAAGLATLSMREINAMYANLYTNLNARLFTGENDNLGSHHLAFGLPLEPRIGSFGLMWNQFNSRFYKENTFLLGYAREFGGDLAKALGPAPLWPGWKFNAGMNLKVLNWQVSANDFTQENPALGSSALSRTGFTTDLGLLAAAPGRVNIGFSLENFIPADMGVTVNEVIPANVRLGTSYLHAFNDKALALDSILGALDLTYRNNLYDMRAGAETWWFKHLLALRAGTTVDQFAAGLSVAMPLNYSDMDVRLDYAFTYPYAIQATYGSHRFSMILRWGRVQPLSEPAPVVAPVEPEPNLAEARNRELAAQREKEEAELRRAMEALQAEIGRVKTELNRINELVKLGQLPSIQFESGQARLLTGSFKTLDEIGAVLARYPQIKVRLEGHTDSSGKAANNQRLSQLRVESVKRYLSDKYRVEGNNLIPVGYGDTRPLADNRTPEGRAQNRRVDIKVLIPAGMTAAAGADPAAAVAAPNGETVNPQDIAPYEYIQRLQEKLKVYQLEMQPEEVERMFEQQHQQNGGAAPNQP